MDLMYGGCSAMSWTSEDGKHFFGRNFDFNRFADGSGVVFLPQGTPVCAFVREGETHGEAYPAKYASLGMGTLAIPGAPVLYDGMNEAGLAGGQLYFRGFARYGHIPRRGTAPVQAGLALPYILSQCATCEEAARELMSGVTIVQEPLFGAVPPLHWCFSDRTGETIVAEPCEGGMRVHRDTVGVMTNSPDYGWHESNLLNYAHLRSQDYAGLTVCGKEFGQCFSGSGALSVVSDLFAQYGADSYIGRCASVVYAAGETVFYLSAVYFAGRKNKKPVLPVAVAFFANLCAVALGCLFCRIL